MNDLLVWILIAAIVYTLIGIVYGRLMYRIIETKIDTFPPEYVAAFKTLSKGFVETIAGIIWPLLIILFIFSIRIKVNKDDDDG